MKLTKQLEKNKKDLQKKMCFLLDEFSKENGNCEVEIKAQYFYVERLDGTKVLSGRNLSIDLKI